MQRGRQRLGCGRLRRAWVSTALLVAITCVLVLVPAFAVVRAFVLHAQADAASVAAGAGAAAGGGAGGPRLELSDAILRSPGPAWALIASSLVWASLIAAVSTGFGVAAALAMRGRWRRFGPLVLVPMALPNYLAYWAFGQLRAPGTWIGDAIEHSITSGQTWVPMLVGRVVAVLGLSLWAWPVVALAVGASLARVPTDVRDAMRMDVGPARRAWIELRLAWRGVAGGVAAVGLLMMGSAVPLHLAQVPTLSLAAWQVLSLSPGTAAAWVALWPVLVPSAMAAGWLAWRVTHAAREGLRGVSIEASAAPGRWWGAWAALVLLVLSVPLPLGAMVMTIRDFAVLKRFGWEMGEATRVSLGVAAWVGVGCMGLVLITARALGGSLRGSARSRGRDSVHAACVAACIGAMVFLLLSPGLLVGAAWTHVFATPAKTWGIGWWRSVGDTHWAMVLAHLSRFAGLAALAGSGIAWIDSRGARELRASDGAQGFWAWLDGGGALGSAARGLVGAAAVGVLGAILSFHEIETTVMVQPPGLTTVAQVVLGYLHFSRLQEMSVAGVYLIGGALVAAALACWALWAQFRHGFGSRRTS